MTDQAALIKSLNSEALWIAACTAFSNETGYEMDSFEGEDSPLGLAMDEAGDGVNYRLVAAGHENDLDDPDDGDYTYGLTDWKAALKEFFRRHPEELTASFKKAARFHGLKL